jgi:tRNA pseudouridine55 synthase
MHPHALLERTIATDGVLLVDKPPGVTSHDVVAIARRVTGTRRIGHTGTLDPFATGLLVLLVGRGTRLIPYVQGEPKVYEATIRFGAETTTDDLTGDITREAELPASNDIDRAIASLTGVIVQQPPDYSAKQVDGRRAYEAARAGKPLALAPAEVTVHEWQIRRRSDAEIDVTIVCGGGTYIRALARDLGRAVGSAAHLTALRRTRSGVFDVANAVSIDELESHGARLGPLRSAIPQLPAQRLSADEIERVRHGNTIEARTPGDIAALFDDGDRLLAIARREGAMLQPRLVMQHD